MECLDIIFYNFFFFNNNILHFIYKLCFISFLVQLKPYPIVNRWGWGVPQISFGISSLMIGFSHFFFFFFPPPFLIFLCRLISSYDKVFLYPLITHCTSRYQWETCLSAFTPVSVNVVNSIFFFFFFFFFFFYVFFFFFLLFFN